MGETVQRSVGTVLPTNYLPPISWFVAATSGEPILIEQYENFQKQSLRNRCYIDSPNGKLALTVPVDRSNFSEGRKCLMRDVMISDHLDWRHQHWYAFESSYHNSPFFDYLQDDFRPLYERQWRYLIDFNEALTTKCLELLELDTPIVRTAEYHGVSPQLHMLQGEYKDGKQKNYYQVFASRHGFLPDLSIVDLIFNLGPEAGVYLNNLISSY